MAPTTLPEAAPIAETGRVSRFEANLAIVRLQAAANAGSPDGTAPFEAVLRGNAVSSSQAAAPEAASVYQNFEAMVLSQLVSMMMNAGGDNVLGDGTAMSAYGSLFADAIGEQIAKRGGVGIATSLARTIPA